MPRSCLIVGAGLAGATAAFMLSRRGYHVVVHEQADVVGGHVRTEWLRGIPYEPQGAHVFHTKDFDIWRLVTELAQFEPYRHRVLTRVHDRLWSWPLQVSELRALDEWADIERELASRPAAPDRTNFETYCIAIMGQTLYELFVRDYTRKQWGRDPDTLAATVADRRVEVRDDEQRDLFSDPYQGWPTNGYTALVERMLESVEVILGSFVTCSDLKTLADEGDPVVVTSALDDFFDARYDPLEWRGIRGVARADPHTVLAQGAMVVNEPDPALPWTRTIETKWALPQLHQRRGTIVVREFPDSSAKHYPVPDRAETNAARQSRYEQLLRSSARNPLVHAGRLATYRYINMDEAIRQGLDAASHVLRL
jgi:UDP-galactopyranose mutase